MSNYPKRIFIVLPSGWTVTPTFLGHTRTPKLKPEETLSNQSWSDIWTLSIRVRQKSASNQEKISAPVSTISLLYFSP
jgi:hypothetical protein